MFCESSDEATVEDRWKFDVNAAIEPMKVVVRLGNEKYRRRTVQLLEVVKC